MIAPSTDYGFNVVLEAPFDETVSRVREALAQEGFGVLTEIDVRDTLHRKLDVEFRPYLILGACNPALAHHALTLEREIGLLLPCNIIVYAGDTAGQTIVSAIDPVVQLGVTGREDLEPIAKDVRANLTRVLGHLDRN